MSVISLSYLHCMLNYEFMRVTPAVVQPLEVVGRNRHLGSKRCNAKCGRINSAVD